ncbi:hypothetical protein [Roseobacter sp. HKCCA0434]|uniref:hypothetical protein n=1 Tax=Roseobacter sp. HKCCA0434 TaxID=3079297 RepID=UPI002905AF6B|nr:hypothetical protein [Roseobacter sp. HKCCA0434]
MSSDDKGGRNVEDVLAAIRARVQAEDAGLGKRPDEAPMRLGAAQQVEDSEEVAPLRLDRSVTPATPAPLRLDDPVSETPLRLDTPAKAAPLRLDTPAPEVEDVPEAPHVELEPEEPATAEVRQLFPRRDETAAQMAPSGDGYAADEAAEAEDRGMADEAEDGRAPELEADAPATDDEWEEAAADRSDEGYDVWSSDEDADPLPEADASRVAELTAAEPERDEIADVASADYDVFGRQDPPDEDADSAVAAVEGDAAPAEAEFPEPALVPEALATAAPASDAPAAAADPDMIRAIVREELAGQGVDRDALRAQVREIIAEEIQGDFGKELARSVRKAIGKDIVRAFKDRGLN